MFYARPVQTKYFIWSLILSPITVAVVGCWLLFIPVYALVLGFVPYLIFGAPLLVRAVRTGPLTIWRFVKFGFLGMLILILTVALLALILHVIEVWTIVEFQQEATFYVIVAIFGCIFAPLWSAVFCLYYRNFTKQIPNQKGDI